MAVSIPTHRHRLLARQLRRSLDADGECDLNTLLNLVERAYRDHDHARAIDHLGMTVAARELIDLNMVLAGARDAAEAANRAKNAFLSNISHEIRTPLNAILGITQLYEVEEATPQTTQRLDVIRGASRDLVGIIDDILDVASTETAELEVAFAPVDIADIVHRVASHCVEAGRHKDIAVTLDMDPSVAGLWLGDAFHIERILSVLAMNAIKFTDRGEVQMGVQLQDDRIAFAVTDTGPGIPEDRLADIFDLFTQIDGSSERRAGGLGLGLAIASKRVRAMGGLLEVKSQIGQGSVFSFSLPLGRSDILPTVETCQPVKDRRLRILVAEDNVANQIVLQAILMTCDADVIVAGDGAEAVRACRTGPFDLVLMDIQMPTMNGIEAAMEIRREE